MKAIGVFLLGAIVGSIATLAVVSNKYERIYKTEPKKEETVNKEQPEKKDKKEDDPVPEKASDLNIQVNTSRIQYHKLAGNYAEQELPPKNEIGMAMPYVITPEKFDTMVGYDVLNYTYYEDDQTLIEDITDDIVTNTGYLLGDEALNRFSEYEKDMVYVINERLQAKISVQRKALSYHRDVLGEDI